MNAPSPTLTSSTSRDAPGGDLLRHDARGDQRDAGHRRGDVAQGVHAPVGRHQVGGLGGDGDAGAGAPARPARRARASTRKPGIDSSLSSVPPVWPRPRPQSLATGTPQAATSGATTSVVLSPTPPVECLSATGRPIDDRSRRVAGARPWRRSRSAVSRVAHPAQDDRHQERRHLVVAASSGGNIATSQLLGGRARRRRACARSGRRPVDQSTGCPAGRRRAAGAPDAHTVAPTSANVSPSWRAPISGAGRATCATSRACSREWSVEGVVGSQPWSDVRTSRSPWRSAASSAGRPASNSSRRRRTRGVVAVAPEHVGLDQVREDEAPRRGPSQQLGRDRDPLRVRRRSASRCRCPAGEDVADLADAVHREAARSADPGQVVRPRRVRARSRAGAACARYAPGSPSNGRAMTRPTACSPVRMLAGRAAGLVQLLERHRLLVGGDLEDAVGRRVDDPRAGALVLLPQPLDDLGARGGDVADHPAAGAPRELRR